MSHPDPNRKLEPESVESRPSPGGPARFSRSAQMGERPIGRLLWSFSLPALVGMGIQATYNIVDTAFVGRLGHEAIAALTLVWPVQLVMLALSVGVGVGANSLIARRLGAGDEREANHAGAQAFVVALLSALAMMFVLLTWTDPVLRLVGARPDTLPLAHALKSLTEKPCHVAERLGVADNCENRCHTPGLCQLRLGPVKSGADAVGYRPLPQPGQFQEQTRRLTPAVVQQPLLFRQQ